MTDDSLVQCVGELRNALDDHGQALIRTVPRRRYRLDAVVTPLFGAQAPAPDALPLPAPPSPSLPLPLFAPSAAVPRKWAVPWSARAAQASLLGLTLLLGAGTLFIFRPTAAPVRIDDEIAARSTVAVMPFAVSGDHPVLRQIAEASNDAITSQFATRMGMRGIGRSSTALLGSAPPLDQIGKSLKATYAVTGRTALAADGSRVSMHVQLLSVSSGEVIWSRRYEADTGGSAALSADVGLHVVNAVRTRNRKAEPPLTPPDGKPSPAALTLLGWKDLDKRMSVEDVWRARTRSRPHCAPIPGRSSRSTAWLPATPPNAPIR